MALDRSAPSPRSAQPVASPAGRPPHRQAPMEAQRRSDEHARQGLGRMHLRQNLAEGKATRSGQMAGRAPRGRAR